MGLYIADLNNKRNIPADNVRLKVTESLSPIKMLKQNRLRSHLSS